MSDCRRLQAVLSEGDRLTTVCHDNPDPDCLASALALAEISADAGLDDVETVYGGAVSHQQNRAFVNLLDIDLERFEPDAVIDRPDGHLLAFVDHAVPGRNNGVPTGTTVDVVIDHHQADDVDARYVDHREDVGATATILTEYLGTLDLELEAELATALLFAIRRETLSFLRGTTDAEFDAARTLHAAADADLMNRLARPSVTGATVDAIGDAIDNRLVRGSVLVTHVGRTGERDAIPQAADYLVRLEGVSTAAVFGVVDGAIQVSARSTDARRHVGDDLAAAFEEVGSAGGHREMAGARIPLGIFATPGGEDDQLVAVVQEAVTARLLEGFDVDDDDRTADS